MQGCVRSCRGAERGYHGHACDDASSDRKKCDTLLDLCVSSLRRGHANLLCIVPILTDDLRRGSTYHRHLTCTTSQALPETHLATSTMGEGEAIDEHVLSFLVLRIGKLPLRLGLLSL